MFVPEEPPSSFLAIPPVPSLNAENRLIQQFAGLATLAGQANLDRIREPYEKWYRRLVLEAQSKTGNSHAEALSAFSGRLTVTALKLALLYHVAEESSLSLSPEALERALSLVGWLQEAQAWLLEEGLAWSRWEKDKARVLRNIRQRPGIPWSHLLRNSHLKPRDLKEITGTLEECGLIVCQDNESVRHFYPYDSQ